MSLAVVILTKNEEDQIQECIHSSFLLNPDEVIVIDSESDDRTQLLAAQNGAVVHSIPWQGYVKQRNSAYELTSCEWLFFLDADERMTPECALEIKAALNSSVNGAKVYRRNWFLERPLYCIEPATLIRLGRRGHSWWIGGHVHEQLKIDGPTTTINAPILHRSWENLNEHLEKNQRYARLMADTTAEQGKKFSYWMLVRPLFTLPKYLLFRRGLLEGKRGLLFALTHFIYSLQKALFTLEDRISNDTEALPFPRYSQESQKDLSV